MIMTPAINCTNLQKKYGRRVYGIKETLVGRHNDKNANEHARRLALQNITFTVPKGCSFGILGHNGAGKSTLLSLLLGVIAPDQGKIQINGRIASLLALGSGFHPELTGRENIILYGVILGMSIKHMKQHISKIIDFAELQDMIDDPLRTYSDGMIARLGFATIIHIQADILLIDEVLAVGDNAFQDKCKHYLQNRRKKNGTLVIVSHDMHALKETCDAGICLQNGQIAYSGSIQDVITYYQHHPVTNLENN